MLVLGGAFSGMLWSTLREGTEYFKNVDEVIADQQAWEGKRVQLHGYVVPGTWVQRPQHARLQVQGAEQSGARHDARRRRRSVVHRPLPDTFKDEAEVVLKGQFGPTGSTSRRTA